jgi:Ca2+-binding EF-hand superfamily protein
MTVTQSYSLSLTYTSLRMYVSQTAPAVVPASSENMPAPPAGDTVTLSPEATAPPVVDETPASAQPEETAPSAPSSRAARRADVLHNALDADEDGAISKEEFVDGAMALLRRAGAHHHGHRVHGERHDHGGHEGHGSSRLERKLDRLFERVDASGDGNVDQAELTDALARVTRERRPDTTETPAPSASQETPSPETSAPATVSEPQTRPAAAMSYTSVTVVIAVKQYTSIAAMNA